MYSCTPPLPSANGGKCNMYIQLYTPGSRPQKPTPLHPLPTPGESFSWRDLCTRNRELPGDFHSHPSDEEQEWKSVERVRAARETLPDLFSCFVLLMKRRTLVTRIAFKPVNTELNITVLKPNGWVGMWNLSLSTLYFSECNLFVFCFFQTSWWTGVRLSQWRWKNEVSGFAINGDSLNLMHALISCFVGHVVDRKSVV